MPFHHNWLDCQVPVDVIQHKIDGAFSIPYALFSSGHTKAQLASNANISSNLAKTREVSRA